MGLLLWGIPKGNEFGNTLSLWNSLPHDAGGRFFYTQWAHGTSCHCRIYGQIWVTIVVNLCRRGGDGGRQHLSH